MRRRKRRHANLPYQLAVLAVVVIFVGYSVGYPFLQSWLRGDFENDSLPLDYTLISNVKLRMVEAFTASWFLVVGAAMGSFLNVVAYRLPRGESVIAKPSHCPYCNVPIKPWHNVPIFGWFSLRGRCRACRLPISPRYILVELVAGTLFLSLYVAELVSGGSNLPVRQPTLPGVEWNVLSPQHLDLILLSCYHAFLFSTLLAWSLMEWDRWRVPLSSWLTAILVAMVVIVAFPELQLNSWPLQDLLPQLPQTPGLARGLARGLASGFALGNSLIHGVLATVLGIALWLASRPNSKGLPGSLPALVVGLAMVGFVLGWPALTVAVAIAFAIRIALPQTPPLALVTVVALGQHLFWRQLLATSLYYPGPAQPAGSMVPGAIVASAILSLIAVLFCWFGTVLNEQRRRQPVASSQQ